MHLLCSFILPCWFRSALLLTIVTTLFHPPHLLPNSSMNSPMPAGNHFLLTHGVSQPTTHYLQQWLGCLCWHVVFCATGKCFTLLEGSFRHHKTMLGSGHNLWRNIHWLPLRMCQTIPLTNCSSELESHDPQHCFHAECYCRASTFNHSWEVTLIKWTIFCLQYVLYSHKKLSWFICTSCHNVW